MALNGPEASKYELAAVHGINRYLWTNLRDNLGMRTINNMVPIIPSQQIPAFNQYAEPFIVYNWVTEGQGVDWYMQTGQIMYLVYSEEERELRQIFNYMRDLFEGYDESARKINEYIASLGSSPHSKFNYKYTNVLQGGGGALPMESEGGRQESMLTMRVAYTVER